MISFCRSFSLSLSLSLVLRCIAILLHFGIETYLSLFLFVCVIVSSSILRNKTKIDVLLIAELLELVNCPIFHTI